jgi:hypothetical protein
MSAPRSTYVVGRQSLRCPHSARRSPVPTRPAPCTSQLTYLPRRPHPPRSSSIGAKASSIRTKTSRPDPILYVGRSHVNAERKTRGVYQKVALTPFDVLVGVVAAWAGRFFDGLGTLRIDYGRRRLGILARPLPLGRMQGFEDEGPQPPRSESSEMVINGRPWGKVMGKSRQ